MNANFSRTVKHPNVVLSVSSDIYGNEIDIGLIYSRLAANRSTQIMMEWQFSTNVFDNSPDIYLNRLDHHNFWNLFFIKDFWETLPSNFFYLPIKFNRSFRIAVHSYKMRHVYTSLRTYLERFQNANTFG